MIHGITIQLMVKTQTGTDTLNRPVYSEVPVDIEDVLVGQPEAEYPISDLNLSGKKAEYWLGIPKGDTHEWTDAKVILPEPFAGTYRVVGFPIAGIEENIPLRWNKKVKVEKYVEDQV